MEKQIEHSIFKKNCVKNLRSRKNYYKMRTLFLMRIPYRKWHGYVVREEEFKSRALESRGFYLTIYHLATWYPLAQLELNEKQEKIDLRCVRFYVTVLGSFVVFWQKKCVGILWFSYRLDHIRKGKVNFNQRQRMRRMVFQWFYSSNKPPFIPCSALTS